MSNYLADGGDNYTFEKVVEFRDLGEFACNSPCYERIVKYIVSPMVF